APQASRRRPRGAAHRRTGAVPPAEEKAGRRSRCFRRGHHAMTAPAGHPRQLAALRLYFPTAAKARATRFWHHLTAPALARHLLAVARRADIRQAMLLPVSAGHLPGERLSHHHPE